MKLKRYEIKSCGVRARMIGGARIDGLWGNAHEWVVADEAQAAIDNRDATIKALRCIIAEIKQAHRIETVKTDGGKAVACHVYVDRASIACSNLSADLIARDVAEGVAAQLMEYFAREKWIP